MFDEFRKRVRNWMEKAKADTGIAKEFKDIFELILLVYLGLGIGIGAIGSGISMRKYLEV